MGKKPTVCYLCGQTLSGKLLNAIAGVGSNLYVGKVDGYFTFAGGIAAINIVRWNGSNWQTVGLGVNDAVLALAASGDTLNVGGRLSFARGDHCSIRACVTIGVGRYSKYARKQVGKADPTHG